MPLPLLPLVSNAQWGLGIHHLHAQGSLGGTSLWLIFRAWLLRNQEKESKKRREERDQEKNYRVNCDPDFVQICRVIILGEKRSTP